MKYKHILLLVLLLIVIDQVSKIYIKTHFYLGEYIQVFGSWFQLYFIENEGMAFGMKILDNDLGKLILTLFRLCAVAFGFFWVKRLVRQGHRKSLLICASLILAGAAGNLIDCLFYGLIFTDTQFPYEVSQLTFSGNGYGQFLHGRVVDMLYFPLIDTTWPQWMPWVGGKSFRFFEPIFNLADSLISVGIITLLLFQNKMLKPREKASETVPEAETTP
ncbi:MAG: lipoprotein signal peptidase [Bacteroidetes bacterium 47-18]|nr:MAG: lipoprotein signal peptidase [Bacteroidetes bacterium 47-18]